MESKEQIVSRIMVRISGTYRPDTEVYKFVKAALKSKLTAFDLDRLRMMIATTVTHWSDNE